MRSLIWLLSYMFLGRDAMFSERNAKIRRRLARIEKRRVRSPLLDKAMVWLSGIIFVCLPLGLELGFDFTFGWAFAATIPVIGIVLIVSDMIVHKKGSFIHPE